MCIRDRDQSSTGSTLFIEPLAIVKLNNDIRELELQEQKEIEAVLATLSEQTAQNVDAIRADLDIMIQLDFIFARAGLALDMNATEPIFNTEKRIHLKQARHPLIPKMCIRDRHISVSKAHRLPPPH